MTTTDSLPCTVCERETPVAELTPSGRCSDCLPGRSGRLPYGAPGPGRAAVRQLLAPGRARRQTEAEARAAALAGQRPTDTTVTTRRNR